MNGYYKLLKQNPLGHHSYPARMPEEDDILPVLLRLTTDCMVHMLIARQIKQVSTGDLADDDRTGIATLAKRLDVLNEMTQEQEEPTEEITQLLDEHLDSLLAWRDAYEFDAVLLAPDMSWAVALCLARMLDEYGVGVYCSQEQGKIFDGTINRRQIINLALVEWGDN